MEEIYTALKNVRLFSQLSDDCLRSLAEPANTKTFLKNALIINEGDDTSSFHIVLEGTIRVFLSDENGSEVSLGYGGPHSYFGELAILVDGPRSASVMSCEKTRCAIITKAAFNEWLDQNPRACRKVMNALALKVCSLTDNIKDFALCDVYKRLRKRLYQLAQTREEKFIIYNKPTQQELANMIGSSREMVSKIFKDLKKGEYINIDKSEIVIEKLLPNSW